MALVRADSILSTGKNLNVGQLCFIFVLRKKGSKTKERMKEEEIEKGDCGPPTRKVFFFGFGFVGLEPSGT